MKSADDNSETVKTLNVKTIRCNGKSKPIENGVEDSSSNFDYEDGMAEGEKEVNGNSRCSSRMNGILEEFTELYNEKLIRINKLDDDEKLKRKVRVLECWVNDLAEQNQILVSTVEELEKEASRRVFLLQEKLDKMALVTRESCVSLRDHQVQVSVLLKQKLSAEDETEALRTKVLHLEATNNSLLKENADLRRELEASEHGRDCRVSLQEPSNENLLLKDSSLTFTSNSSLEDEIEVGRLKSELEELKKSQREANLTLTQRDQHIASLQAQLTDLHRKLSAAQAQVHNTTSTLHSLMDRGRHDSFEIIRRDDVIRQLLSPSRRMIKFGGGDIPIAAVDDGLPKPDVEAELSENIDLLASRLRELEEECERLRARNDGVEMEGHHSHKPSPNSISLSDRTRASSSQRGVVGSISRETQTSEMVVTCETQEAETKAKRKDSKEEVDVFKLARLENELSEKNILIRELQNHLVLSREELRLKDETLCNVEQKLECSRRNYDEKEERMLYLTSQLTNLQLEVSRLHGNTQRLRLQLENKSELVLKLECENRSLVRQLNDKSSVFEGIQKELSNLETQLESKNKQVSEQKLTIGSLQDALVTAKINLDKLQSEQIAKPEDKWVSGAKRRINAERRRGKLGPRRRAKSVQDDLSAQEEELIVIADELERYVNEATEVAKRVDKEWIDVMEKKMRRRRVGLEGRPSDAFETERRREILREVRENSRTLVLKLRHLKMGATKHRSCDDLSSYSSERRRRLDFLNEDDETFSAKPSVFTKNNFGFRGKLLQEEHSEVIELRKKVKDLEESLRKEKNEQESFSKDAHAVVESVRRWLNFQKIANSQLEEKFRHQHNEIISLIEENQILVDKFRSLDVTEKCNLESELHSVSGVAETLFECHESLTNDTGIEDPSRVSSRSSPTALLSFF